MRKQRIERSRAKLPPILEIDEDGLPVNEMEGWATRPRWTYLTDGMSDRAQDKARRKRAEDVLRIELALHVRDESDRGAHCLHRGPRVASGGQQLAQTQVRRRRITAQIERTGFRHAERFVQPDRLFIAGERPG